MLTQRQHALISLMRTPHADGATHFLAIIRAIEEALPDEQVGLVAVFLQSVGLMKMPISAVMESATYTETDRRLAGVTLDEQVRTGTIEFLQSFVEQVPLSDAAAQVLRQLELLRPLGPLVQAVLLYRLVMSPHTPYADQLKTSTPLLSDDPEVWDVIAEHPDIFAPLYQSVAAGWDKPLAFAVSIETLLSKAGDDQRLRQAIIALCYGLATVFVIKTVSQQINQQMSQQMVLTESDIDDDEPLDPKKAN